MLKVSCYVLLAVLTGGLFGCSKNNTIVDANQKQLAPSPEIIDYSIEKFLHPIETMEKPDENNEIIEIDGVTWGIPQFNLSIEDTFLEYPYLYKYDPTGEWLKTNVVLLPEMVNGAFSAIITNLHFIKDQWLLTIKVFKKLGFPNPCFYDFYLNEFDNQWIWDDPSLSLPDYVNEVEFLDYVLGFETIDCLPEGNYYAEKGLNDINSIWRLIYQTAYFDNPPLKNYNLYNHSISFDQINRMALYLYGDKNFNIRDFLTEIEEYVYVITEETVTIVYPGESDNVFFSTYVIDCKLKSDNSIAVTTVNIYSEYDIFNERIEIVPKPEFIYREYYPIVVKGTTLFTLSLLKIIDASPQMMTNTFDFEYRYNYISVDFIDWG